MTAWDYCASTEKCTVPEQNEKINTCNTKIVIQLWSYVCVYEAAPTSKKHEGDLWFFQYFHICAISQDRRLPHGYLFSGIYKCCRICSLLLILFLFFFHSTIHGRIDQVNQLLELDYQKRGGARYTALDKWTNQLNTLNQAIVSKLTWWHVKSRDKENGMF